MHSSATLGKRKKKQGLRGTIRDYNNTFCSVECCWLHVGSGSPVSQQLMSGGPMSLNTKKDLR